MKIPTKKGDAAAEKAFMSNDVAICWSCQSPKGSEPFFCKHCGIIQPFSPLSAFALLGVEERFELDENQLEQKYFALQQQLHPDRFAAKTSQEKMFASQQSMAVNDAYNMLKNPLDRANSLLVAKGGLSYKDQENRKIPPDLLMQSMMQREALSQAKDQEELHALYQQSQNKQSQIIEEISNAFRQDDIKKLENLLLNLQYEQKFIQEIKQKIK